MGIDPLLLEEYNEGVRRSMNAYWTENRPMSDYERKLQQAKKSQKAKARRRARERAKRREKQQGAA